MKKIAWLFLACILFSFKINAQSRICECAPQFSPLSPEDFESFFPPSLIKSKRITEVKVLISSSQKNTKVKTDTAYKIIDPVFTEGIFTFNKDGYAISNQTFYQGKPNHHHTYKRDNNNWIRQYVFEYTDSLGNPSTLSKPQPTDYTLDGNGNILKIKKSDFDGKMRPDEKSEYTVIEYNKQGWKSKETRHFYWDWEKQPDEFIYTYYTYQDKGNTEIAKMHIDNKLHFTTTTNYDNEGKPLTISLFSHITKTIAEKSVFKYDSLGRLIKYTHSAGKGSGSECLDRGNFNNEFKYNNEGLLIEQRHTYVNTVCILKFEYK